MSTNDSQAKLNNTLALCPFCGGEARIATMKWNDGYHIDALCLSQPNFHYLSIWDKNEADGVKRIAEAWNTRAERTCQRVEHGKKYGFPKLVCSECGYGLGDNRWRFCPKCGGKIKEEE